MKKILIIGANDLIQADIEKIFQSNLFSQSTDEFTLLFENDPDLALKILFYESVDITILNFTSDSIPMLEVLAKINEDLWLCNGSLIAIHNDTNEDAFLAKVAQNNIISVIPLKYIKNRLPNVLKIVLENQKLIFQREIPVELESSLRGRFILENNPFDVTVYASIISLYLFNANLIDLEGKSALKTALVEMLMNAIEHGNCAINFEDKSQSLLEGKTIFELIEEKNQDPNIARKKILLDFSINRIESRFVIEDEGEGFDWRKRQKLLSDDENAVLASGRGIFITTQNVSKIEYNEKGNRVSFTVGHQSNKSNLRPKIFQAKQEVHYQEGELVFQAGEVSNFLSYIVSGKFLVFDQSGSCIATLTPQDIFIGEMAFLLGNRRTATVQADEHSIIIQLTKNEFMLKIQEYPYYGLFLARLLAQRMVILNQNRSLDIPLKSPADFIQEATSLLSKGHHKEACNLLKIADYYHPHNWEILFHLGRALARHHKYNAAVQILHPLTEDEQIKDPGKILLSMVLCGFSYYKLGLYKEAENQYFQALQLDENNADLHLNLLRLYEKTGNQAGIQRHKDFLKKNFAQHPLVIKMAQA